VGKSIILASVHLLVLLYELFFNVYHYTINWCVIQVTDLSMVYN